MNNDWKEMYMDLAAGDGLNDLEVLIRANLLNYRVKEIPVQWTDLRESKRTLRRILWGEIKAITKILLLYKLNPKSYKGTHGVRSRTHKSME